jgi:hypothetical protein
VRREADLSQRDLGKLEDTMGFKKENARNSVLAALPARTKIQVGHFAFSHSLHCLQQSFEVRKVRCECIAGYTNDDEAQCERTQVNLLFDPPVNR